MKKNKRNLLIFLLLFIACISYGMEEKDKENPFSVNLRLDKLNFHWDEQVMLRMYIKNITGSHAAISIYENKMNTGPAYSTFQPVVFDMKGREAEIIVKYRLENKEQEEVVNMMNKRTITLAPDEELSHLIDLKNVYRLVPGRKYRVKGFFFPDYADSKQSIESNVLSFMFTGEKKKPDMYKTAEIIHNVSPSEIVMLSLDAERARDWKRMFKYYRVDKYISSYPEYVRQYNLADKSGKMIIENDFMDFLSRDRSDYILDFNVVRDEIEGSGSIAHVNVMVTRFAPGMPDRYLYRFSLEKYKDMWLIVSLEATVIKEVVR